MTDATKQTHLVRSPQSYVMHDGVRLVRKILDWNRKIQILDDEAVLLAEATIRVGFFADHELQIRIVTSSAYNSEILAMLSIEAINQLRMITATMF